VGDGECQEGQVWEAVYCAARYRLANLTVVLDHNHLQQFGFTDADHEVIPRQDPLPPHPERLWEAWGWDSDVVPGHDVKELHEAFRRALAARGSGRPRVVVAETVKGRGVSFMAGDFNWHAKPPSREQLAEALAELGHPELALK
jgi:transketolase